LFLFAGCTNLSPIPTLTLRIKENQCSFDGPLTIVHGKFIVNLMIDEQEPTDSGYALVTLDNNKTIEDINTWLGEDQPPWMYVHHGVHEMAGGDHTYSYDLSKLITYTLGEPLFLVCMRAEPGTGSLMKLGAFGPIQVEK
jgi:hypothetical protein